VITVLNVVLIVGHVMLVTTAKVKEKRIKIMNEQNQEKIDDLPYEVNDQFISWIEDHYEDDLIQDMEDAICSYNESECDIVFGDQNGQYIPKLFASLLLSEYTSIPDPDSETTGIFFVQNVHKENIAVWKGINKDDLIVLSDSENLNYDICDHYWDVWNDVLMMAKLEYDGKNWILDQDGDLWIRSEHYIYMDQ